THIVPPSMAGALQASYDPYSSVDHGGSLAEAQAEMRLSTFDHNGDGKCDLPACKNVFSVVSNKPPAPNLMLSVSSDLAKIGITLDIHAVAPSAYSSLATTPSTHLALVLAGWAKDVADACTFIEP